ncbi:hypothetical protein A2642_00500 [Candidatus Nomurabacteria bacterium RIFCSPHIGHO2_01_FULL_39_10]|uniref:DUF3352 domain-containing protein n=1 Tax=Candidatus Nomurabacteria bacterium RIFCSPHIGHO2_01_FULL_39_10 TaxID=1801733 RepID=A0A1F6V7R4_9BACT|nr:MAG: hypothetical protein A2642_00500 [Candidatus Nomurabacteria bacterium RIFCSPHIGHO2_01_FULL_39_10]
MEQDNKICPVGGRTQNKIIKTYASDMERVIEDDTGGGLIKKIIHGEEEHEKEKMASSPESKKNKFFMFIGIVLLGIGLTTLSYLLSAKEAPTVSVERQFVPLIFNDKSVFVEIKDFTKDQIVQTILNATNTALVKQGGVQGIYPTYDKKMAGLRQFVSLIKGNFIPGSDIFVSENFLMGVVNSESKPVSADASAGKDFFILLKVRSNVDVFDSLRAWEKKMFSDLHGFFGVALSPETKYLLIKEFQNGVVENKNARLLFDKENKIVMMYILADDTSVIITNTENATHEIMLRLASSQVEK